MLNKHNPNFKLISKMIFLDGKHIELVYCISNGGSDEGMEAYYFNSSERSEGHYRSYRWNEDEIPNKYMNYYSELRSYLSEVPEGHKLNLN